MTSVVSLTWHAPRAATVPGLPTLETKSAVMVRTRECICRNRSSFLIPYGSSTGFSALRRMFYGTPLASWFFALVKLKGDHEMRFVRLEYDVGPDQGGRGRSSV